MGVLRMIIGCCHRECVFNIGGRKAPDLPVRRFYCGNSDKAQQHISEQSGGELVIWKTAGFFGKPLCPFYIDRAEPEKIAKIADVVRWHS